MRTNMQPRRIPPCRVVDLSIICFIFSTSDEALRIFVVDSVCAVRRNARTTEESTGPAGGNEDARQSDRRPAAKRRRAAGGAAASEWENPEESRPHHGDGSRTRLSSAVEFG